MDPIRKRNQFAQQCAEARSRLDQVGVKGFEERCLPIILVKLVLEDGLLGRGAAMLLKNCDVRLSASQAFHVSKGVGNILDFQYCGASGCWKGWLTR